MPDSLLYLNGINGDTGGYDVPPLRPEDVLRLARGETTPANLDDLRSRHRVKTSGVTRDVKAGIDRKDLSQAGWGVIFPAYPAAHADRMPAVDAIREALQPLLQLRRRQAGERFAAWTQGKGQGQGFRVGRDTKNDYLLRQGAGPGPVDPNKVPYYVLIVASPDDIPYSFQVQLDVQYAVGRIYFKTLDEYANYAAGVVAAETSPRRLPREAAFFSVANRDDPATALSTAKLMQPLTARVQAAHADWSVRSYASDQATKADLASLLGGDSTPAFLFTAGHGMKFAPGSPRQLAHQGALLCQDWPGPRAWTREIPQDFYFAGDDLRSDGDLLGLIAFFFACYGGGTPQYDEFLQPEGSGAIPAARPQIAPYPFLAQLPAAMLGRPRGALAVVGHVERVWGYSFDWDKAGAQTTVFESALQSLLDGHPIGSAIEYFNDRYAELSTMLNDELREIRFGKRYDPLEIAGMWMANNDARGYAVIGDPAVRLPVARGDEPAVERSSIEVQAGAPAGRLPQEAVSSAPPTRQAPAGPAAVPVIQVLTQVLTLSAGDAPSVTEIRTYVSNKLDNPPPGDLKVVTRRADGGALETVPADDVAGNAALLALHQAAVELYTARYLGGAPEDPSPAPS